MKKTVLVIATLLVFAFTGIGPVAAEVRPASLQYAQELSNAFEYVAEKITPSVVNIEAKSAAKPMQQQAVPQGIPGPFQDFFRRFPGNPFQQGPKQGLGSGFVVDKKGHILTNNHVIEGFDTLTVTLSDKRKFEAKVVGTDPSSDLAVIKIDATGLIPAELGDSDGLRIGEWVVAAGTPFGLDNTITTGIVSAKGRSFKSSTLYQDYIQTDAAINPGNSGGPLVNLQGQVIGINNSIYTRSGGYMGIGFAIPMNMARSIMQSIIKTGKVRRGWLGVAIQDLSEQLAKSFNYPSTEGALVGDVMKGSPADDAGLQSGDIIIKLDGKPVEDSNQLRNTVAAVAPGTKIVLDLIRSGRALALKVKLGERKQDAAVQSDESPADPTTDRELGLELEELNAQIAQQLGVDSTDGVVVARVYPGSVASEAGLRRGDVIRKVADRNVHTVNDFRTAMKRAKLKDGVRLIVETQGMKRFVFLQSTE